MWDILAECELTELTIGRPGLLVLCILGRKYNCGVLGLVFIRFIPSCSLISLSFIKDSMVLLMMFPCLLVGLCGFCVEIFVF